MERNRNTMRGFLALGVVLLSAVVLYSCGGGGGGLYGSGTAAMPIVPGMFSLSSPADGATGVGPTPTLTWTAAAVAADYRIQIDTTGMFTGALVTNATVGAATLSYTVPSGTVTPGTTYFWRVLAENIYGRSTAGPRSFTP